MKRQIETKTAGALAARAAALLCAALASAAHGTARDGVRCPNGYETRFDTTVKTMRCERSTTALRPTVCDPAAPEHVLYRSVRGRDFCVRPVDSVLPPASLSEADVRRRAVVCIGDDSDGLMWQVDIDSIPGDRDRCRATRVEWIYPSQQ